MSFILNELGVKPSIDLMNRTPGQLSTVTRGTQKIALLGEDVVTLTVESVRPIAFEIGDVMNVYGRTYRLNRLPAVQKQGERLYTYEVEMEGAQYDLLRVTYDLTIDTTSNKLQDVQGDALTGDLRRFATVLISNASRVFAGQWALGECPETAADRTLTFGETDNCLAVLQRLCKEFETEFEIAQAGGVRTIHFKKVGQTFPFTFRYGRGKGLYALERQNVSSSNIITRLKVYGSTRNITARYRAQRLCLPGKKKGESCIEKTDASWRFGVWEATKYFEDIYPKQKGRVTAVDADSELVFTDSAMAFDLSEKVTSKGADGKEETKTTYLLPGTSAKVHFNSGNLSGYEFEVAKYDHATKTFTLKAFKDDRGETFPSKTSAAFRISVGDEYSLLDIAPPQAVVDAAEKELEEAGNKYYDQNSQPKVQYGLTVAEEFLRSLSGVGSTSDVFAVGDYIPVEDEALEVKKSVRIQSFTRNLLRPYDYQLTLSDTVTTSIINRLISDQIETDKIIRMNNIKDPATARANWRRSREVMAAVFFVYGSEYLAKLRRRPQTPGRNRYDRPLRRRQVYAVRPDEHRLRAQLSGKRERHPRAGRRANALHHRRGQGALLDAGRRYVHAGRRLQAVLRLCQMPTRRRGRCDPLHAGADPGRERSGLLPFLARHHQLRGQREEGAVFCPHVWLYDDQRSVHQDRPHPVGRRRDVLRSGRGCDQRQYQDQRQFGLRH